MNTFYSVPVLALFANSLDAYIPELWANESLAILLENMVVSNLVHRDFEDEVASFGDIVNTRRPGEFTAKRKTATDDITLQDATATNVQVPLNQHFHTSFIIRDEEWSKSFKDLVVEYVQPAMQSIARAVDQVVLGQVHKFLANKAGKLNGITSSDAVDYILDLRQVLNDNKAYVDGRRLIVTPSTETVFLKDSRLLEAQKVGDDGTALREASLGRKLGFDIFMCQNMNYITDTSTDYSSGTVTDAHAAGFTGSATVTLTGYNAVVGEFIVITGDQQPQIVSARTLSMADTTAITVVDEYKYATLALAPFKIYHAAAVNGNFSAGYAKGINIDGHTSAKGPQVGQLLAFGTGGSRHTYTIIATEAVSATETLVTLDRPLDVALSNNDAAFPGPSGSLNWAFHRNSLALVTRPLVTPPQEFGARSGVVSDEGMAIRATMQYNSTKQGLVVTLDLLCGVKELDTNLGAVLLA
jgi:hypothetical protein